MSLEANLVSLSDWFTSTLNLSDPIFGQTVVSIGLFIGFLILGWVVYHIFQRYFSRWAKKTKTKLDDEVLKNIKKPIYFLVVLVGSYYALNNFSILNQYSGALAFIFIIAEILLITFIITRVVNVVIAWYAERRSKEKMSEHILFVFKKIINFIIYMFAFLIILYVLKIDLSGAVVGLGVGGIAIAFALQNVLSDAFSAFSIYFDKPFEIGDFIIVGEYSGTVKKIGMKSTRVLLLQGEELVLANSELTKASVRNFKKMKKRRISFSFGVTYGTPTKKLKKIPGIIKDIISSDKLEYVVKYKDTQQEINFAIKEAFEKEGIEMAFPTQTIFLEK